MVEIVAVGIFGSSIPTASKPTENYTYTWNDAIKTRSVQRDSGAAKYSFGYDSLGRMINATNPDNTTRTISYSDTNNTKTLVDEDNKKNVYHYDWADRLIWVREHLNSTFYYQTNQTYDEVGNLLTITDAKSQKTTPSITMISTGW